jgi:hypothetical protein
MTSANGYKTAFWVLLITVVGFQVVITVIAHTRHEESHQVLLPRGRPQHPLASKKQSVSPAAQSLTGIQSQEPPAAPDPIQSRVWQEVLSTSPKIILLHNFASKEE